MAKFKKRQLTIEDRLAEAQTQLKKLTRILKSFKDMQRRGSHVEDELEDIAKQIKDIRDKYKEKIEKEIKSQEEAS